MNFSNLQEWVDGFSGLSKYTPESIESWYKLQPKVAKYPEVISSIRLGFDGGMIDDAIKSLIVDKDTDKLRHAKEVLVREMSTTFSLGTADASVLDMNKAILPPLSANDIQGELPVGTKVICNKTGAIGTIMKFISWNQYIVDFDGNQMQVTGDDFKIAPREDEGKKDPVSAEDIKEVHSEVAKVENFSAFDNNKLNDIVNYIAETENCNSSDVRDAIEDFTTNRFPTSRHMIEMFIAKRYHFPLTDDGHIVDTILEYAKEKEKSSNAEPVASNFSLTSEEKLKVIKDILADEGIQAKDEMINDLGNIYFGSFDDESAFKALTETFKFYNIDVTEDVIGKIISKISDKYKALDQENFSRKECIEALSSIFKKHNLGLGINEVKYVYDFMLQNDLDIDKTAEVLVGIKTNSQTPLQLDTAKEVLKHFKQECQEKHLSDGFVNFSQENFNKLLQDAEELADLAVAAGLNDKFIFDNYDKLVPLISKCENSGEFLLVMTSELLDKKQFKNIDEAALAAQDFYEVLHDSNWKKKHIKSRNFSENMIERLVDAGYSAKEIAIKLHEPISKVQDIVGTINNFSFYPIGKLYDLLSNSIEWLSKKLIGPERTLRLTGETAIVKNGKKVLVQLPPRTWLGKVMNNMKFWKGMGNFVTLCLAVGFAGDFIFACWDKLLNALHKKTDEERYEEVMKIIESDKRYKSRAGRMAKAFLSKVHTAKIEKLVEESGKQMAQVKNYSRKVVLITEDK